MRTCMLILSAVAAHAASNWIRVSTPSIEIFTDANENTARSLLNRLETLRGIFRESAIHESPEPLRVFLFSSEKDFAKYRPDPSTAGFYTRDEDKDFIVLAQNFALNRIAAHEYLHMVIRHSSPLLPPWIEEGLPEFYSTTELGGTKLRIGGVIPLHLRLLQSESWLSAEDLAHGSSKDGPIFYAESWALVHMLSLGPGWRGSLPQFIQLLGQGRPQSEAFFVAFGASMTDALEALQFYRNDPKVVTISAPPVEDFKLSPATKLDPLEISLTLADLALRTGSRSLARSLFERAAQEHPESPAAIAGLGSLALAEDRKDDAQRFFEKAIVGGYSNAETFFQMASLTKNDEFLKKALAVDPNFADAHFLLGTRATDQGDFASAIDHLRRATAARPRRFTYWHALAYAQSKSGDRQAAAETARRATILASTAQEEEMAATLTQLAAEPTAAAPDKKAAVTTPKSWQNPKGDTQAEGTLALVDCESDPLRLVVTSLVVTSPDQGGKPLQLYVRNPSAVELVNADGIFTTLVCGPQSRPVTVEYVKATKTITRIDFKRVVIMKR